MGWLFHKTCVIVGYFVVGSALWVGAVTAWHAGTTALARKLTTQDK